MTNFIFAIANLIAPLLYIAAISSQNDPFLNTVGLIFFIGGVVVYGLICDAESHPNEDLFSFPKANRGSMTAGNDTQISPVVPDDIAVTDSWRLRLQLLITPANDVVKLPFSIPVAVVLSSSEYEMVRKAMEENPDFRYDTLHAYCPTVAPKIKAKVQEYLPTGFWRYFLTWTVRIEDKSSEKNA